MLSYGKQHKRLRGLNHLVYTYLGIRMEVRVHTSIRIRTSIRMEAFFSYKSYLFQRKERKEIFFREPDV